ncbi:MAG TPA: asparagine synthase-related protein [Pyrinomonadaceae bacterium]|nr:asparagine synthase-related protein [Pyrinomonadaceae bacterium]
MSGIVGIINLDGAPVDRDLLRRMTDSMSYRGPDAREIWIDNNVGFGHAMLRTTFEAETEKQPLTLDGKVWLTADARIDGRAELITKLEAKLGTTLRVEDRSNGSDSRLPNDAELILHAYHAWGEDCVKHLIGDFAFVIWDKPNRKLFCARDHLGVKPFYYITKNRQFYFSSSPHCLRKHPLLSAGFNEQAIGDFLIFEMNRDGATSAFKDISRLPPAHILRIKEESLTVSSYWRLSPENEIHYSKRTDYLEQFEHLMLDAVRDRLRTPSASMLLSGGMDSTTVAAFCRRAARQNNNCELQAFTYVYDHLMPDQERHFSGIAARALSMPISYLACDQYKLFQTPRQRSQPAEIINEPLRAFFADFVSLIGGKSRVAVTGDSGDALLCPDNNYPQKVMRSLSLIKLLQDTTYSLFANGRIPRMGFRRSLKSFFGISKRKNYLPSYPSWINPDFESRLSLRDRWNEANNKKEPAFPRRQRAFESMTHPMWPQLFEDYDPDTTGAVVEFRYPFFDKRVVSFLLNIPSLPWCFDKALLRISTKPDLPETIRKRSKTLIVRDPILVRVEKPEWQLTDYFRPVPMLSNYVDVQKIDKADWLRSEHAIWMHVRPLSLNFWLQSLS